MPEPAGTAGPSQPAPLSRGRAVLPAAVAAGLTLPFLGHSSLWSDETDSASAAARSWTGLARLLSHQDAPLGGYYALLHVWTRLAGDSAYALRLPSALAVVAAVWLTTRLGARLAGGGAGLLGGGLLATNPFVLSFGADARPYALALAAAAGTGLLLSGPVTPRRRAAYAGLVVLGTVAHLFFVLAVVAQLLGVALARGAVRPWLLPSALAAAVTSPLVVLAAGQTAEVGYLARPGLLSLPGWFQAMAGGQAWLSVPAAVLLVVTLRRGTVRAHPLLLAWLLVPGPALLLLSQIHPLYLARYVVESAPALAVLLAVALARGQRVVRVAAACLLLVSAVTSVTAQAAPYRYEGLRAAADIVLDDSRPGDGAVFLPVSVRTAVGFYLGRVDDGSPRPVDLLAAPAGSEEAVGNFGGGTLPPLPATRRLLGRRVVWLVSYTDASGHTGRLAAAVLGTLHRCYLAGPVRRFGLVAVQREVATGRCPHPRR